MKRSLLVFLVLLALPHAGAQGAYFGLRVDVVGPPSLSPVIPLPGLQFGGPVLDDVELRVSLHTLLLATLFQADVLYTQNVSETLRVYGGAGGDAGAFAFYDDGSLFGVHATAGLEYQPGPVGFFAELQPLYILHAPPYLLSGDPNSGLGFFGKLNLGINFHF